MRLGSLRLVNIPPFEELDLSLSGEGRAAPRAVTVVCGGGGVGKTSLLNAIALTRPGNAMTVPGSTEEEPTSVICDWALGLDDPARPHPLRVASPLCRVEVDEQRELLRRREQALFDKMARQGGFAFLLLPSTRWFSRQPLVLGAPGRTLARYDVRGSVPTEDAGRADLARETKQALAYSEITAALARASRADVDFSLLAGAMRGAVQSLVSLCGYDYEGVDPASFEPVFCGAGGRIPFDALPTRARHLVAFAALPVRMLWAAYPGKDPLSEAEGVVAIDDVDLHLDAPLQNELLPAMRRALPSIQWIVTAASPHVAAPCDAEEVIALRRLPHTALVEVFSGASARIH